MQNFSKVFLECSETWSLNFNLWHLYETCVLPQRPCVFATPGNKAGKTGIPEHTEPLIRCARVVHKGSLQFLTALRYYTDALTDLSLLQVYPNQFH